MKADSLAEPFDAATSLSYPSRGTQTAERKKNAERATYKEVLSLSSTFSKKVDEIGVVIWVACG